MTRSLTLAALAAALAAPAAFGQQNAAPPVAPGTAPRPAAPGTAAPRPGTFAPRAGAAVQPGVAGQPGTAGRSAVNDQLFAMAAADGGMAEVALSELGQQRATDPELKRFSQQMIQEHTRMNGELMQLAQQKRVAIPRTVDVRAQFCAQSLAGLTGQEFDRCYAKAQLITHMDAVAMFTAEAERGVDPDMKALAARALPHIKQHLAAIKPIAMRFEKDDPSDAARTDAARTEKHDNAAGAEKKDDK